MRRNPLYIFKNEGSVGIYDIPLNSIVQILESSSGRVLIIELLSKANLTIGATIAHILQYPLQYNTLSDGTAGGELIKYQEAQIGYKLDSVDTNLYGDIGKNSVDFSSQIGSTSFDRGATGELSFALGSLTLASGINTFSAGLNTTASGNNSFAIGSSTSATGDYSFASGFRTTASGVSSSTGGQDTQATGLGSRAEGVLSISQGVASHAEGYSTHAASNYSHAEGFDTTAGGLSAHAEGNTTSATGFHSHAEGFGSTASGIASHSQNEDTKALGRASTSTGVNTEASGDYSFAGGDTTLALGLASISSGNLTTADGIYSIARGQRTIASGELATAGGRDTIANGLLSIATGKETTASAELSSASGYKTQATALGSMASGTTTVASSEYAIATGGFTTADGEYSKAGGFWTNALARGSVAEGYKTTAGGNYSVALGSETQALNMATLAIGTGTISTNPSQFAAGMYNTNLAGTILEIGIGQGALSRKNALEIYTDGSLIVPGLETSMIIDDKSLVTKEYIDGAGGVGTGNWGSINGILSNQTDLQAELDNKENALGNPVSNGDVLVSDVNGNRFWAPNTASGIPDLQDFDSMDQQTDFTIFGTVFLQANVYANGVLMRRDQYAFDNDGTNTTVHFTSPVDLDTWVLVEYYNLSGPSGMCNPLPFYVSTFITSSIEAEFEFYNEIFTQARVIKDGLVLKRTDYYIDNNGTHTTVHIIDPVVESTRITIERNLNPNFNLSDVITTTSGTTYSIECGQFTGERLFVDGELIKRSEYTISGTRPGMVTFNEPLLVGQWILVEYVESTDPLSIVHDFVAVEGQNAFTIYGENIPYVRVYRNGIMYEHSEICIRDNDENTVITVDPYISEGTWIAIEWDYVPEPEPEPEFD